MTAGMRPLRRLGSIALLFTLGACAAHEESGPVFSQPKIQHGLSRDVVGRVVHARTPALRTCYDAVAQEDPTAGGTLAVGWTIQPDGRVTELAVVSSTVASARLATCVLDQVRTWRFPEAGTTTKIAHYPFEFGASAL
jgi:hypothetical protein